MLICFDFASDVPLYRQLRDQIVLGIASGELSPGEKLPTVRVLAEESGVNMMTVSKAYQMLKAEGYLTAERRGGTVVAVRDGVHAPAPEQLAKLYLCISELRLAGLEKEEILALCDDFFKKEGDV